MTLLFCCRQCWILLNSLAYLCSFGINGFFRSSLTIGERLAGLVLRVNDLNAFGHCLINAISIVGSINRLLSFLGLVSNSLLLSALFAVRQRYIMINGFAYFSSFFINGFLSSIFPDC